MLQVILGNYIIFLDQSHPLKKNSDDVICYIVCLFLKETKVLFRINF